MENESTWVLGKNKNTISDLSCELNLSGSETGIYSLRYGSVQAYAYEHINYPNDMGADLACRQIHTLLHGCWHYQTGLFYLGTYLNQLKRKSTHTVPVCFQNVAVSQGCPTVVSYTIWIRCIFAKYYRNHSAMTPFKDETDIYQVITFQKWWLRSDLSRYMAETPDLKG